MRVSVWRVAVSGGSRRGVSRVSEWKVAVRGVEVVGEGCRGLVSGGWQ